MPIFIPISEVISRNLCALSFSPGWMEATHPAVGQRVYMTHVSGTHVRCFCPPEVVGVWLLKHAWSGAVSIEADRDVVHEDLYAEIEDHSFVLNIPEHKSGFELTLRTNVVESDSVKRSEVWILGFLFSAPPKVTAKSEVISQSCRLITGDHGRFLTLNSDRVIPSAILLEGSWAPRDVDVFRNHVNDGDLVIDVGANFGHHTVVFSKLVGPRGLVISIEAQKIMFELLCANCVINGCHNVTPLHMAATDRQQDMQMYPVDYDGHDNFGALGIDPHPEQRPSSEAGEMVSGAPIDDIIDKLRRGRRVSFIKLDVQAHEIYVLRGLTRTLAKFHPIVFFEVSPYWNKNAGYSYLDLYALFSDLGYTFRHFSDRATNEMGWPMVDESVDVEWDVLAIPAEDHEPRICE